MLEAVNVSGRSNEHIDMQRGTFHVVEAMELSVAGGSGLLKNPLDCGLVSDSFTQPATLPRPLEPDSNSDLDLPVDSLRLNAEDIDRVVAASTGTVARISRKGAADVSDSGDMHSGTVRDRSESNKSALAAIVEEDKPLWEVGKWMFGTSVVLGLVFGLFSDRESSPLQVSLVCAIQVSPHTLHTTYVPSSFANCS